MEPMLAQTRETLPPLAAGRMAVQPKFDGFRALLYTPLRTGDPVLLQTRRGALFQDRFPDLAAAARSLPNGLVLDGDSPSSITVGSSASLPCNAARPPTATPAPWPPRCPPISSCSMS